MNRHFALASLFACAAMFSLLSAAAPPAGLPGPVIPDGLGVNIHFTDPRPGELEMLSAAGFRWVRMDFVWQGTERTKGNYDFSAYDRLVAALDHHRLRALFILDYSNPLYETDRSVRTAAGREAFARWAAAAVKHFQGRGIVWEIWNEPNISGFWKPVPDATDYTALAIAAAKAIRAVAPAETIVAPATSTIDLVFLENCFRGGLLEHLDAVSVHPYRQNGPESAAPEYRKLRQLIAHHAPAGKASMPVLSGEWGYSAAWSGYQEDRQGEMLPRQFLTNLACGIPLSIWYDWHDDGTDPKEPEHHFGTVGHEFKADATPPFRPKPAWHAAQTLSRTLAGTRFSRRLATGRAEEHCLLFESVNRQVIAVWTTARDARTVQLPVAVKPTSFVSHLGQALDLPTPAADSLTIQITGAPRYLVFEPAHPAITTLPAFPAVDWQCTRLPGRALQVVLRKEDDSALEATLQVTAGDRMIERPVSLRGSAAQVNEQLQLAAADEQPVAISARLLQAGRVVLEKTVTVQRLASPGVFAATTIRPDGDPKARSSHAFAPATDAPALPGFSAPVWKLDYRFDGGWCFLSAVPAKQLAIDGQPRSFRLWVHGNAGRETIRLRVRDANGRTWQPDGGTIHWQGWRLVEFPLDNHTAHWGGTGEETIRYPLHWDALFLLDNTSRQARSGTIHVAAPGTSE